ncbi:MAG: prephenate dehydrogenase/arogenate dehydrogenase family protein, partial [Proteobacteria bacterium]|nr:prephenate dehydrogenase/arogenate dehydrogenase family protein [Pseudomonadota bacterium]
MAWPWWGSACWAARWPWQHVAWAWPGRWSARARESGMVDAVGDVAEMVAGADLVVLATPVGAMAEVLRVAAPGLPEGALVTDVGSVKALLAETLPGLLPPGAVYVGAHPMAGSHLRGVEHARADLFDGASCALTPVPGTDPLSVARVADFWRALGARVVERDPQTHDAEVAWVSHVPHVLAFAFAEALRRAPAGAGELAGNGFRDFTRIARSDAELWGDILCANRKALVGPLEASAEALAGLARAIEAGDIEAVERVLSAARIALAA